MIYVCLVYLLLKVNSCENEINNLLHALKRLRKVVALSLFLLFLSSFSSSLLALAIVKWRQNGFSQSVETCLGCKVDDVDESSRCLQSLRERRHRQPAPTATATEAAAARRTPKSCRAEHQPQSLRAAPQKWPQLRLERRLHRRRHHR